MRADLVVVLLVHGTVGLGLVERVGGVLLVEPDAEVVDRLRELCRAQLLGVVVVSDSELTAEALDSACTAGGELFPHVLAKLSV